MTQQQEQQRIQTILNHIQPPSTTAITNLNNTMSSIQVSPTSSSHNKNKISLSSHVLETGRIGKPYHNLKISLYTTTTTTTTRENEREELLATGYTNDNGRVTMNDWKWTVATTPDLQTENIYRVRFWLRESGYDCMYPFVDIHFQMKHGEHYHIPLLLNPYGYSTYKGS